MSGQIWEVIGGGDKGGIIVRSGQDTSSPAESSRLSTGALVKELQLAGDRLQYERLTGTGPATGWVAVTLKDGKELMARRDPSVLGDKGEASPPPPKFVGAKPMVPLDTPLPERIPDRLKATLAPFNPASFGEVFANIMNNEPGEHYGLHFPHTPQQVEEWGVDWLNQAFHAAGTLPEDNSIKRIVSSKFFPGGGAGVKQVLTVEYEKPSDDLHTELFLKMPLDPSEKNRTFCISLAMEGSEVIFNRFFSKCLPIRTPKYYFGDINMKTTNWILITEKLPFADKSQRGKRLAPYELEAPVLKGMDWILPDKVEKYYALWRTNAIMAAWAHTGKLGSQISELWANPNPAANVLFPVPEKRFHPFFKQTEDFVLNVAPQCFPKDIANAAYMAKLEKESKEVSANIHCFNDHFKNVCSEHIGLIHNNSHIDNSFFWVDDEGRSDAGLLDFGGLSPSLLAGTLGNNMGCVDAEVRAHHMEGLVNCFCDTLHEFGGPKFVAANLHRHIVLVDMKAITGAMSIVESGGFGGILENKPREEWASVKDLTDPVFDVEEIATMMLRTVLITLVEGLKTWKLADYHTVFTKWRALYGTAPRKK